MNHLIKSLNLIFTIIYFKEAVQLATTLKSTFNLKDKIFAHLETSRPYTVIWCGLVSLIGACIAFGDFPPLKIAFLAFFIPMLGWTAGLYLSDYLDRNLDAIQKPHRPIPSGRIKPKEAIAVGGIFAITGFSLSFLLSINNVILVFVVALLVLSYAKITKSRDILGNLNRGFVTFTAYIFGVFSINLPLHTISFYIWLLSLLFLIHDTNSNLVGAIRDIDGDKKGGYLTIPVKYGVEKSIFISLILSIAQISLIIFLTTYFNFLQYPSRFYALFLLALGIICTMYITIFKSIKNIDRKKALLAHEFFVGERITLASAFIFGMVHQISISISIFLISISITLISQYRMRKRYEFM
jgi:4-hydroxybenzoate polyprenyltransferase/geranylgeranylglycerol-phosphate geranylgeranyltransferase